MIIIWLISFGCLIACPICFFIGWRQERARDAETLRLFGRHPPDPLTESFKDYQKAEIAALLEENRQIIAREQRPLRY